MLKHWELGDIDILEGLKSLLHPFKEATVSVSIESCSSISLIMPLLVGLLTHCKLDPSLNDQAAIHRTKATIYHDLEDRLVRLLTEKA